MYFNDIGQPMILDPLKTYGPYEKHNGPLVLTTAAFEPHVRPNNWCRQIIGSAEDIDRYQRTITDSNEICSYYVLNPYEATLCKYKGIKTKMTLIPAGNKTYMYYLQNDFVNTLIVDKICGYLDFIPKAGPIFHRALAQGIDVMYIEDLCFISNEDTADIEKENIYALLQLIRPKHVFGLRLEQLPSYLSDLCVPKDYSTFGHT